jgi:glycosyltransferase involved in cell wall biosynthesis
MLDLLLPAHWGRARAEVAGEGRLAALAGRPGVARHGRMPYDEFLGLMGRADVAVDLFERTLEREYAVVTRSVVALACGVPVIHPPFTEVSPLVARYDAGWLVDPDDPEALEVVLDEIVSRPEGVAAKGAGARRLWAEVLDPEVAAAPLARLARRLLAG